MTPQECFNFLMEEAQLAVNDGIPITADKFIECAEVLEAFCLSSGHALEGWL